MPGFIHDKLEIKFLILYIMTRVIAPIDLPTLADLAMCDEGVDYFDFAEAVAELVHTEHLTLDDHKYAITDKGRKNGAICESSLPYSVRMQVDQNIVGYNEQIKRAALVGARVDKRPEGGCTVTLSLSDELDDLMELKLLVTREDMAKEMQKTFQAHAEEIYTKILAVLYGGGA